MAARQLTFTGFLALALLLGQWVPVLVRTESVNTSSTTILRSTMTSAEMESWVTAIFLETRRGARREQEKCDPGYYRPEGDKDCEKCTGHNEKCEKDEECCGSEHMVCLEIETKKFQCKCKSGLYWENKTCTDPDFNSRLQFMTAAQVALGAALVIAVSALSALTCKMCSSRRRLENAQRRESRASSLNSIQRFVLERLRDRPPGYNDVAPLPDKPPSYEEAARLPIVPPAANRMRISRRSPPEYTPSVVVTEVSVVVPVHSAGTPIPCICPMYPSHHTEVSDIEQGSSNAGVASFPSTPPYEEQQHDTPVTLTSEDIDGGLENPAFVPEMHI